MPGKTEMKSRNLSGLRVLAIWWIDMNLNDFPAPNSIQSSFNCFSWLKVAITIMTTLLSPGLIIMWACSLEACFTWTKIFSSTSSRLHCIKDHISRAALLVTTYWLPTYSYLLLTLPLCLVFPLQLYLISKGTIQPYVHYISGMSSSLLEQGKYQ